MISKPPRELHWWQDALVALIVLTVLTCLFYYEVVFLNRTFFPLATAGVTPPGVSSSVGGSLPHDDFRLDPGASAWQTAPWSRVVARAYASGQFPLWDPYQGFGAPLLANAQSGGIDVFRLPFFLSSSTFAWDFYYLGRTILGGLGAYLFARTIGLVRPARYFLAIAYIFSGHFVLLGNNPWIEAYLLLPVILIGTELAATGRGRLGFSIISISVCFSILAGMPEVTLLVGLAGLTYGIYRLVVTDDKPFLGRIRFARGVWIGAAWLVGAALAAPLLVPLFEYSANAGLRRSARATYGLVHANLADFYVWFAPYFLGRPVQVIEHIFVSMYVGVIVVCLALVGLYPSRSPVYRRVVPFAALLAAFLLAKTYGVPVINEFGRLPAFNVTGILKWSAPITGFCLALIASVAVDRLVRERGRPLLAIASVSIVAGLGALSFIVNRPIIGQADGPPVWSTLGVALLFGLALLVVVFLHRVLSRTAIGLLCCGLVWVELFVIAPHGIYAERRNIYPELPYIRFLESRQGSDSIRIFAADAVLYPNNASAYGLADVRSMDALYPDRYTLYVQNFLADGVQDRYVGSPIGSPEEETRVENNPWLNLAGVRYVITKVGSTRSPKISSSAGTGTTPMTTRVEADTDQGDGQFVKVYDDEVQIFRNRRALPRAFVVGTIRSVLDANAAISTMSGKVSLVGNLSNQPRALTDADRVWQAEFEKGHGHPPTDQDWADRQWSIEFAAQTGHAPSDSDWVAHASINTAIDPARIAIVEGATPDMASRLSGIVGTARISSYGPSSVVVDVVAKGQSFLVLTDVFYPGWTATIDGRDVPLYPTDLAFRGLFVPDGQHRVEFSYRPTSFAAGEVIAGVGVVALILVVTLTRTSTVGFLKERQSTHRLTKDGM